MIVAMHPVLLHANSILLVLHFLAGEKFFREAELGQFANAHRIQNPVEMVAFVLYDPRMEPVHRAVYRFAVFIPSLVAHLRMARHQAAHAGHAQPSSTSPPSGVMTGLISTVCGTSSASG